MTHTEGHLGNNSDRMNPIDKFYVSTGGVLKEVEVNPSVILALNVMSLEQQRSAIQTALNSIS